MEPGSVASEHAGQRERPSNTEHQERALHVLVPEAAHMQARMAALASRPRLSFKAFMARLMLTARPFVDQPGAK